MWHTSVIHLREKSFGSIALFVSHFLNLRLFGSSVVYQVQGSNRFWLVQCKTNDTIDNWDLMMLNAVKIWIKNPFSGCHNDITLSRYSQYTYIEKERERAAAGANIPLYLYWITCALSHATFSTLSVSPLLILSISYSPEHTFIHTSQPNERFQMCTMWLFLRFSNFGSFDHQPYR